MKKIIFILSAFLLISITGCSEEDSFDLPEIPEEPIPEPEPAPEPRVAKVIAHRGYWNIEGSAENSMDALKRAIAIEVYGSEFDIQVTKDNTPVINHDDAISGKDIQTSLYDALKDIKLSNGEKIPLFEEFLKEALKQTKTKLIIEIKDHKTLQRNKEVVAIVYNMVKEHKAENLVEYISTSMDIGKELLETDKNVRFSYVSFASNAPSPKELKGLGFYALDYNTTLLKNNPKWFVEAQEVGLKVNVWTANWQSMMEEMIDAGADYITTDYPVLLQEILKK